jgi:hypothetical protein
MPVVGFLNGASPGPYAQFAAAFRQGLSNPFLNAPFRILDVAALSGPADDALERRADA